MKRYKYITIGEGRVEAWNGKPMFAIRNIKSGAILGCISYYPRWKQYVFESEGDCVFNNSCLRDVLDFMENEIPPPAPAEQTTERER